VDAAKGKAMRPPQLPGRSRPRSTHSHAARIVPVPHDVRASCYDVRRLLVDRQLTVAWVALGNRSVSKIAIGTVELHSLHCGQERKRESSQSAARSYER
jgi:hypothetical protein